MKSKLVVPLSLTAAAVGLFLFQIEMASNFLRSL